MTTRNSRSTTPSIGNWQSAFGNAETLTRTPVDPTIHPDKRMIAPAAQTDSLLAWMSSLADMTRLRLLRLLERHELGVVDLCDVLQLPQSSVSRHLKVLSDQKWVRARRQNTTRLYRTILDELEPAARKLWLLAREQTDIWPTGKQDQLRLQRLLSQRKVDSQIFFAGAAAEWDRLRLELYGERFSTTAMLALLPPDTIVADLGCGSGNLAAELAGSVQKVIGVDSSTAMLKAAKRRTLSFDNVDLRKGDLAAVPIDTASCDAALLVLALTYLPEPARAVSEMARILKPGGRGVIVDLLPHDREDFRRQMGQVALGLEPKVIEQAMTESAFTKVSTRLLPPESHVKGPALFLVTGTRDA
jgi:ubiquinone/menaquinone biosynthesis C-methylase UbiE/DNA-binding transcriptional ArsR family regulator